MKLPFDLTQEDILLLLLLFWIFQNRRTRDPELLCGLAFLFYVGIRPRMHPHIDSACDDFAIFPSFFH